MKTRLPRLSGDAEIGPGRALTVLLLILFVAGFCSALHAISKLFWYDEMCTVIMGRLQSAGQIWKALANAADTNPPLFYLIARTGRQLVPSDELGYRLPSIFGLLATICCVYFILSPRVSRLSALVGASFILCTPLVNYAYEARPYALETACISFAVLGWERIDQCRLYSVAAAIALALAVSLHYYAVLVWPAFCVAELTVGLSRRRWRPFAWMALIFGALPLLFFSKLLSALRQYYGTNFWARPGIPQIFHTYDWVFNLAGWWGLLFAAALGTILLSRYLYPARPPAPAHTGREVRSLPIEDQMLALMLLALPITAAVIAKAAHSGMTDRYVIPSVLGGALCLGYLIDRMSPPTGVLLFGIFLTSYALSSVHIVRELLRGSLFVPRSAAAREVEEIISQYDQSDLPIVVSSGIRYLPMAYYTPADLTRRLYVLVDPPAAIRLSGYKSDSVDLALLVLQRYCPLQVEKYNDFVTGHREFLLVAGPGDSGSGEGFDWWPARLLEDGNTLQLVSPPGATTVYKVTVKPGSFATSSETPQGELHLRVAQFSGAPEYSRHLFVDSRVTSYLKNSSMRSSPAK